MTAALLLEHVPREGAVLHLDRRARGVQPADPEPRRVLPGRVARDLGRAAVEVAAASAAKNVTAFNNPTPQPVRPCDCQDVDELRARHRN